MLTDLQRIEHMIENAELPLSFSIDITKVEYASSVEKQYAMKIVFVMLGRGCGLDFRCGKTQISHYSMAGHHRNEEYGGSSLQ